MSIEVRVSGELLSHTYIVNKGRLNGKDNKCLYQVQHYRPHQTPSTISLKVVHDRRKSFEELIKKIYDKINSEELGEKNG